MCYKWQNLRPHPYCVLFVTIIIIKFVISIKFGGCPINPNIPGFNMTYMSGVWYELERNFNIVQIASRCPKFNVHVNFRGHLHITIYAVNKWTGELMEKYGFGYSKYGSSKFRFKVTQRIPDLLARALPGSGRYDILFVDYDQYAIIWSCSRFGLLRTERVWLLGRSRDLNETMHFTIDKKLEELNFNPDNLSDPNSNANCTEELP